MCFAAAGTSLCVHQKTTSAAVAYQDFEPAENERNFKYTQLSLYIGHPVSSWLIFPLFSTTDKQDFLLPSLYNLCSLYILFLLQEQLPTDLYRQFESSQ